MTESTAMCIFIKSHLNMTIRLNYLEQVHSFRISFFNGWRLTLHTHLYRAMKSTNNNIIQPHHINNYTTTVWSIQRIYIVLWWFSAQSTELVWILDFKQILLLLLCDVLNLWCATLVMCYVLYLWCCICVMFYICDVLYVWSVSIHYIILNVHLI